MKSYETVSCEIELGIEEKKRKAGRTKIEKWTTTIKNVDVFSYATMFIYNIENVINVIYIN